MTPRQVDQCEPWEIARLLGVGDHDPAVPLTRLAKGRGDAGTPEQPVDPSTLGRDMIEARLRAAEQGLPPPTWEDVPAP